jgi:hypothetical protein
MWERLSRRSDDSLERLSQISAGRDDCPSLKDLGSQGHRSRAYIAVSRSPTSLWMRRTVGQRLARTGAACKTTPHEWSGSSLLRSRRQAFRDFFVDAQYVG